MQLFMIKIYMSCNWSNLIHMIAKTKDGMELGNIISIDNVYLTVRGKKIFKFPVELIERYKKNKVFLDINTNELYKFKNN